MIREELLPNDLIRHYSDENKYIIQNETGIEYAEAVDRLPCEFTYSESEREIEQPKGGEV